jgi:hypothetical protein
MQMTTHLNYTVGLERVNDLHRAAEYSRLQAAARERREPQRERAERARRARLTTRRRTPKLA